MENTNFLEKMAAQFGQNATIKNVCGEPIQVGEKTIIPVAQIAYGLGGGYGKGMQKNRASKTAEMQAGTDDKNSGEGEGSGGGGGMRAKLKGVYEVTPTATRFIPASNSTPILIGVAIGFLLRGWLTARGRKR